MTHTMKNFLCWTAAAVRDTVYSDIGALPSDADAVFLAAHTPMVLRHQRGAEPSSQGPGEHQVLQALLADVGDANRNTLIAVTGGSGSGKSHVVRWVRAHLDPSDERFHVLYVPRAVQTIRELLRRIVAGLPGGGGEEFMARIDAAVGSTTPAELGDRLLEEMRLELRWTLEPRPERDGENADEREARENRDVLLGGKDEQGKRRNGLADLLAVTPVNRALLRPDGRLDQIVQSVYEETSRRDAQRERGFGPEDLPLREAGMRRAVSGNTDLRDLWDVITYDPGPALALLDEAVIHAAPRTFGMHSHNGETLDLLFRNSRQVLRQEGKELVLLFEDLAQFGLIDGEMYDQFVTQPGSELAPLRVVFAVTDGMYPKLGETVRGRVTHEFSVTSSALTDRNAFVARYLNLVRLGRRGVEAAWAQAEGADDTAWVQNACDIRESGLPCRVRDLCHRGFGTVEVPGLGAVGLYPYNDVALRRALEGRGPDPTPRAILDTCVSTELVEAEVHLRRGTYPHARVFERFDFRVQRPRETVLGQRSGDEADRLYRALVIWGDEAPLAPEVGDAFSLDKPATGEPPSAARESQAQRPEPAHTATPAKPSPLLPLYQWRNGARLLDDDANYYRTLLRDFTVARLDLDQDLFHTANNEGQVILGQLLNLMSFDFGEDARGRRAGTGSVRFPLGRNDEDMRVLMGARWFDEHGHWQPAKGAWAWPAGYEPVDLMVSLECRLESWAETVRRSYRERVRGRGLARAALGVQAAALLATGAAPSSVSQVGAVLSMAGGPAGRSTPAWVSVDRVAAGVLSRQLARERVGQFAAVRQGDTGAPQLIDAADLQVGLQEFLRAPVLNLRRVVADFQDVDSDLAAAAKDLLSAIEQATPAYLGEVASAVEELVTGLEGQDPGSVARAAHEVGQRARDSDLFRPPDGWSAFRGAVDTLAALPSDLPMQWRSDDQEQREEEALMVQHWGRATVPGARALEVVRQSLVATHQKCLHSGRAVGDLDERLQEVRKKLSQLEGHLQALSTAEAGRG
jgi:hypothetical protein